MKRTSTWWVWIVAIVLIGAGYYVGRYVLWPAWRQRYAPDVTHNVEHTFSACVAAPCPIRLSSGEHERYIWMPWRDAVARCLSPTNREALKLLPRFVAAR